MAFFHRFAGFRLAQASPKSSGGPPTLINQVSVAFPSSTASNNRFLTFNDSLSNHYQHPFSSSSFRAFVKAADELEQPETPKAKPKRSKKKTSSSGSESDGSSEGSSEGGSSPVTAEGAPAKPKKRGRKSKAELAAEALLAEAEAAEAQAEVEKLTISETVAANPAKVASDTTAKVVSEVAIGLAANTEDEEVEEVEEEVIEDGEKKKRKRLYKRMKPDPNPNREIQMTMRALANKESKPLSPKWMSYVLSRCGEINKASEAVKLFEAYYERVGQLNSQLYGALIGTLCSNLSRQNPYRDNQIVQANKYFAQMRAAKLPIELPVWTSVLRATGSLKRGESKTQKIDQLRSEAEAAVGSALDLQFYNTLLYAYVKAGAHERAESIFQEIHKRFPETNAPTWNAMIDSAIDALDFDRPFELFDQMVAKGVAPDEYTYIRLINLCGKQRKLDKAQELFEMLRVKDPKPGVFVWTALIDTYCRASQLRKAFALVEDMKQQGAQPDKVTWNILRQACIRTRNMDLWKKHRPASAPQRAQRNPMHRRRSVSPSGSRSDNDQDESVDVEDANDDDMRSHASSQLDNETNDSEIHPKSTKSPQQSRLPPALVVPGVTRWKHRPDEANLRQQQAERRSPAQRLKQRSDDDQDNQDDADVEAVEDSNAQSKKKPSAPFASVIGAPQRQNYAASSRGRDHSAREVNDEDTVRDSFDRNNRSPHRRNNNRSPHRSDSRGRSAERQTNTSSNTSRADSTNNWRRPQQRDNRGVGSNNPNQQAGAFSGNYNNRSGPNNRSYQPQSSSTSVSSTTFRRASPPPRTGPLPRDLVDFRRARNAQQKNVDQQQKHQRAQAN